MDSKATVYNKLIETSKAQIDENVRSHKLRAARIQSGIERRLSLQLSTPKVPLDFYAIGDSWFEYPLWGNGPFLYASGIVEKSQLGSMGSPPR